MGSPAHKPNRETGVGFPGQNEIAASGSTHTITYYRNLNPNVGRRKITTTHIRRRATNHHSSHEGTGDCNTEITSKLVRMMHAISSISQAEETFAEIQWKNKWET